MADGILPEDLEWLERKANRARSEGQWFTVPEVLAGDEEQFSRLAEKWRAKEERYRRILAALTPGYVPHYKAEEVAASLGILANRAEHIQGDRLYAEDAPLFRMAAQLLLTGRPFPSDVPLP